MRKLLTVFALSVISLSMATASYGAIGWAGQIWPVDGNTVTDNSDVNVYFQIWKEGVTDPAGQGAGISATLWYALDAGGPYTSAAMAYNTDVGNNDEYTGAIPSTFFQGEPDVYFYCTAYDSTDATTYEGAQDQNSNDPPFMLNITNVLSQDVTVWFSLCLPDTVGTTGDVCVTGSATELTSWGDGVLMSQPCVDYSPEFYQVGILFPAGSNPYIEYKYKKDGCATWESTGNHSATIDDSKSVNILPIDHWEFYEGEDCPNCGVDSEESSWGAVKSIYR